MIINHNPKWAFSANNEPISLYWSLCSKDAPILLIGGVHGDEPEGVELAEKTLNWLQSTQESVKSFYLITCINPDGYKEDKRVNGNGVDLNRNYPTKNWEPMGKTQDSRYYPGDKAGSESEVKALASLIQKIKPRLIIHCHSWNPCIVCTGDPGLPFAEALTESSGYETVKDIGYPTPGSLSQYGWTENQIPVICIEEQDKLKSLDKVWTRFSKGIHKIFTSL